MQCKKIEIEKDAMEVQVLISRIVNHSQVLRRRRSHAIEE